jgi:hypothetical protein
MNTTRVGSAGRDRETQQANHTKCHGISFSESLTREISQLISITGDIAENVSFRLDILNNTGAVLGRLSFSPTKSEKVTP